MSDDIAVETPVETIAETPAVETAETDTPKDWFEGKGLSEDEIGYLQNKGNVGPDGDIKIFRQYRELEKFHGVPPEDIIRKPAADDKEGWDKFEQFMGRPEKAEGYKFDDLPEGVQLDERRDALYKEWAFAAGLPSGKANELRNLFNADVIAENEVMATERESQRAVDQGKLKVEWAGKYDERWDLMQRAMNAHGITDAQAVGFEDHIGLYETAQMFAKIGDTMGEDWLANQGKPSTHGTTRDMITNQLNELNAEIGGDRDRAQAVMDRKGPDFNKKMQLEKQLYDMSEPGTVRTNQGA